MELHLASRVSLLVFFILASSQAHAAQGNDSCQAAQAITGVGTFSYDSTAATTGTEGQNEGMCYSFGSTTIDLDVWFEWTADFSGVASLTTCGGTSDDTKVAAYPGGGCPPVNTAIGCGDDSCGYQSTMEFAAIAGSSYMIQIGHFPGAAATAPGTFTIQEDVPDYYPETRHYYDWVSTGSIDWASAKAAAEQMYYLGAQGHLASISNAGENDFLSQTFGERAWIGGSQDHSAPGFSEPGGGFTWSTGEPFAYQAWAAGEPSNFALNEHFIEMFPGGEWNDQAMSGNGYVLGFYIEYEVPVLNPSNGHFYDWIDAGGINFDSARALAASMSYQGVPGHLATITSDSENDFIANTFDQKAWIGAFQDFNDPNYFEPFGGWTWVTGEPWVYDSWNAGEPNDGLTGDEHYAEAWQGHWNDKKLEGGSGGVGGFFVEYSDVTTAGIYCSGDSSNPTGCPCGNVGLAEEGCANGTGLGGKLRSNGSSSISAGDLVLTSSQLIPSQPGLYFQGNNAINTGDGTLFGDGIRCAGGGVIRLQIRFSDSTGSSATNINVSSAGGVSAGDTKRYQIWYRDPASSPCGALFNLSNGIEITFSS